MKTANKEILDFNVPVSGICETLAEAVAASGTEEEVVNTFNSNVLAHSHYAILRRAIVKKLVELTGIKLKTTTVADKEVVDETEGQYIARLETDLGDNFRDQYASEIASVCASIPVDYKPGVRGSGEGAKPAAKWLAYYDQMVKEGKLEFYASKYGVNLTGDVETDKVAIANVVKAKVTAAQKAAAEAALA